MYDVLWACCLSVCFDIFIVGCQKPISQFDLFSGYFRPVSTLSILTVLLYICRCVCCCLAVVGGRIRRLMAAGHVIVVSLMNVVSHVYVMLFMYMGDGL